MNTSTLRVAGMVTAAVAVTAIATAAVTAAVTGSADTLSPGDVDRLLSDGTSTTTSSTTPSATTPATTATTSAGDTVAHLVPGTVTVHCDGNLATLVSWSPNPGFRSDDPVRGPAAQVSVRFESDTDADYLVTGVCVDGTARVEAGPDNGHHGGGRNRGSGDDY